MSKFDFFKDTYYCKEYLTVNGLLVKEEEKPLEGVEDKDKDKTAEEF